MIDLTISFCPLNTSLHILSLQFIQVHRGQTYQESNLTILSTPFYETRQARQARHFMKHAKHANFLKHAKHANLWSTPIFWSTSFYEAREFFEARQARKHVKHSKHGKHASTPNTWARQARKAHKHAI